MSSKYYAMINDERRGPFSLEELADAGVQPDTYVWCKGMDDWQQADEVADICRYFRQRLVELRHPRPARETLPAPAKPEEEASDGSARGMSRFGDLPEPEWDPADHDPGMPPPSGMLGLAILVTLICFPFTGAAAIYYAVRARKFWEEARRSCSRASTRLYTEQERQALREEMAASVRQCKMWTGITAFIGLMVYAALMYFI